jgi:hypothetical protein
MKRIMLGVVGLVLFAAVGSARAGVEADPNKDYIITPDAGPFAICVRGYSGDTARDKAHHVVLKLRENGWPAYMYDFSAEEERKAKEILDERYRNYPPDYPHRKTIRVEKHWGVFVGGYRSLEDAGKAAARLKREPKEKWPEVAYCDTFERGKGPPVELNPIATANEKGNIIQINPYFQAFASRNPTYRDEQKPDTSEEDAIIKKLNSGRPYNMLAACGGHYTLIVKVFEGGRVVQAQSTSDKFLETLGLGKEGEVIDATRKQAEEVARVLREQMKLDAYVLHTRTGSVLSIGILDDPESPAAKQLVERIKNIRFTKDEKTPPPPAFQFLPEPTLLKVRQL